MGSGSTMDFLNSFHNYEKISLDGLKERSSLSYIREVLDVLGSPDSEYSSVHIAGTKGKGSTAAFTAGILEECGYTTGLYASPHVNSFNERISVNGCMISDADLDEVVKVLLKRAGDMITPDKLTYFEVLTIIAILYFSMKKVSFAVFECGLGGRLDATNVISPAVCGITPVSYDHAHILGSRLTDIAREKAAIIKKGAGCVTAVQEQAVMEIIEARCREKDISLEVVGSGITYGPVEVSPSGTIVDIRGHYGEYKGCRIGMPGFFQAENYTAAVGICEELRKSGIAEVDSDSVRSAGARVFLPGRLEILSKDPCIIIDGAQNASSVDKLKYSVEQIFKYDRLILLLGISADKDIEGICRVLKGFADEVILTRASVDRAADPAVIRGYFRGEKAVITGDVPEAVGLAFSKAGKDDMILVTGSFFLAGEVREIINCRV